MMDNIRNNDRRFIYFYFNRNDPQKIRQIVPAHVQYWEMANIKEYMGGPFGDRTGGLISFAAPSLEKATEMIQRDPFILEDLISEKWIKEWIVE
jgi:uncharacterized protein YciI